MTEHDRQARFTLSEEDYTKALRLNVRRSLSSPKAKLLYGVLAAAAVAAVLVIAFGIAPGALEGIVIGGVAGGVIGLVLFPLAMYAFALPARAKTVFGQQTNLRLEMTVAWTETALTMSNSAGTGTIEWQHYHRWREDDAIVVVLQSDAIFQMIPKRALTGDQIDDMRRCATLLGRLEVS